MQRDATACNLAGATEEEAEEEASPPTPQRGEPACLPLSDPDPGPEPFDAPPGANPERPAVGGPGRDSAEAIALETWAKKLGADSRHEGYAHWARQKCDYVPVTWIRALLEHRVEGRSGTGRANVVLLQHILGAWMKDGACPYLAGNEETPGRSTLRPPTPNPEIPYAPMSDDDREYVERIRARERQRGAQAP